MYTSISKMNRFLITSLCVGIWLSSFGQVDYTFKKTLLISYSGFASGIKETSDGGFIVVGTSYYSDTNSPGQFLLKLDKKGTTEWCRNFSYWGGVGISDFVVDSLDNIYFTGGYRVSPGDGDVMILKSDPTGNILWCKHYGGFDADGARSIELTSDNNLVMSGVTQTYEAPGAGAATYILKTDLNGNVIWNKFNYDPVFSQEYVIKEVYPNKYVSVGNSCNSNCIGLNVLDNNGNILASKNINYSDFSVMSSVAPYMNKGYLLAGATASFAGPSNLHPFLVAIDSNYQVLWARKYSTSVSTISEFFSITQLEDGNYLAAYEPEGVNGTLNSMGIANIDQSGNIISCKIFDQYSSLFPHQMILTKDGGFAEAGYVKYTSIQKPFILKGNKWGSINGCGNDTAITLTYVNVTPIVSSRGPMYSNGTLATVVAGNTLTAITDSIFCIDSALSNGIIDQTLNSEVSVFPNPGSDHVDFILDRELMNAELMLTDIQGRVLMRQKFFGRECRIVRHGLPCAVYFYQIIAEGGFRKYGKVIFSD